MYELEIKVTKVLGTCTACPPMRIGDWFRVADGAIRIPKGGWVCLYALQSLIPLIPAKERDVLEDRRGDWLWRVRHVQCPDPEGRVIFRIDRASTVDRASATEAGVLPPARALEQVPEDTEPSGQNCATESPDYVADLCVLVEEVRGRCTSGMRPGDFFTLRSGRLYVPASRHFCLYAMQAVLPLLPAKQRPLPDGDWLKEDSCVICPDPAGNVVMRIERL